MQETQVQSLGQEDPLEEEMATHSSILAGKMPWTEDSGGWQSMGSQSQTRLRDGAQHGPVSCLSLRYIRLLHSLTAVQIHHNHMRCLLRRLF